MDVEREVRELSVAVVVLRADLLATLGAIEAVSRAAGLKLVDGLPLLKWHAQQRAVELEKVLISLEDIDPAFAAQIQAHVDLAKKDSQS